SAGVADPLLEEARAVGAFEDFMPLSVARLRTLTIKQKKILAAQANDVAKTAAPEDQRRAFLKAYIEKAYDFSSEISVVTGLEKPRWKSSSGSSVIDATFAYTEKMWDGLLRKTNPQAKSSLLDLPYPMLVPGGRFQETYYWDTYFGMKGLLATDRLELAQMQTENLLSLVQRYGFVPNGNRDFYLTRSQPPFLSSAVKEVFEASLKNAKTDAERKNIYKWLKERAYPLVQKDYDNFWMNPETRFDKKTGLNHHWDDANLPRPERHGNDNEHTLGKTYRDVRAGAESGLDFTDAHAGESSAIAPVLLNSMLYKVEADLAWMAKLTGDAGEAKRFANAAEQRSGAMRKFLWNKERSRFDNFNLNSGKKIDATIADTFAPLFVGMASQSEADLVQKVTLPKLERAHGIMASDLMKSHHQWDGSNGWAPQQVMAVAGLQNYGHAEDAKRLARKWVAGIAKLHEENKTIYERIDVVTGGKPIKDETKYPTQEGFLWTNGSFSWMLCDILGVKKSPL
ncbi:MAG: trehalase family glycosidase, partial [Bdellovibrionota bacterium]